MFDRFKELLPSKKNKEHVPVSGWRKLEPNKPLTQMSESHTLQMDRKRKWEDKDGFSINAAIGDEGKIAVENVLARGGVVMDIGAGEMVAVNELAALYPQGQLLAVEPHPPLDKVLPTNVSVIGKKIGEVTEADIADSSVDVAYSAYTLTYIPDKIDAIATTWRKLKKGGKAYIQLWQSGTTPSIQQIFQMHGYEKIVQVINHANSPQLLILSKDDTTSLNFGAYTMEYDFIDELGKVFTTYRFDTSKSEN